jgi:anti-sigma factor RsiW
MKCRDVRTYLFAFLDDELGATLSLKVQRHLDGCPVCARDAEIERTIGKQLTRKLVDEGAGTTLDAAAVLRDAPRREMQAKRVARRRRFLVATGVTMAAGLGVVLWGVANRFTDDHGLGADASSRLTDLLAWVRDRIRVDVLLPSAEGLDGRLVGARSCTLAGQPAVFAIYELAGVRAAVVVLPRGVLNVDRMRRVDHDGGVHWADHQRGHTVLACRRGDMIVAAVSTLNETQLLDLMRGVHESD